MTPKQKAQELVDKYLNASFNCKDCDMPYCDMKCTNLSIREAKQCALIAVDEMILFGDRIIETGLFGFPSDISFTHMWKEVKKEIEAL
jgi:hypothetical protein